MILKGNQRGGGKALALHLLNAEDNEHVEVHELRGFLADDLRSALHEAHAVSRGTKARQYLFSLSLNPPSEARVSTEDFERAIETAEKKLGLENQPRAIVFHEKEGRRHAHAVWSRIDAAQMKAINLPYYKLRLRDVSRELYYEHGWTMPHGLANAQDRDPANFTHAEWQQAKRGGHDPKQLKSLFQDCWAMSDSGRSFAHALKARGYTLARGKRGHVAVDYRGEVYAVSRYTGHRVKAVRDKLGDADTLPSVEQVKCDTAERMTAMLRRHVEEAETQLRTRSAALAFRKRDIVQRQRHERAELEKTQKTRVALEAQERAQRLTKGLRGLWDRLTGKHARQRQQNELEALHGQQRDRAEKDRLVFGQLDERKALHQHVRQAKQSHAEQMAELHQDIAAYATMKEQASPVHDKAAKEPARQRSPRGKRQSNTFDRDR